MKKNTKQSSLIYDSWLIPKKILMTIIGENFFFCIFAL